MWSQRVQEERGRIMCWADLGATGLSVQGPVGDGGQISVVIIMLRGRCSPSSSQPLPSSYLRLHFSPRAKVRWPGEQRKVKGNAERARGRRLSLAMQLDLLTYNLKFYSPSFFFFLKCFFFFWSCSLTAARPSWDRWNAPSWILIHQMLHWGNLLREVQGGEIVFSKEFLQMKIMTLIRLIWSSDCMHVYLLSSAYIPQSESALLANYVQYVNTCKESDSGFKFALNVLAHGFKDNLQEDRNRHTAKTNKDNKAEQRWVKINIELYCIHIHYI